MDNVFKCTIVIVLIALLVFIIWNLVLAYQIKEKLNSENTKNKELYFELKYQLQYIVAIFAVITALIAFLGYNSFEKIDIETERKVAILVNKSFTSDSVNFIKRVNCLHDSLTKFERNFKILNQEYIRLKQKDILTNKIFVLNDDFQFISPNYYQSKKIYYKNIDNGKNPSFKKAPSIIFSHVSGAVLN